VSDLAAQVYRETETPQPVLTRNDSIEDVIEARTAFVYNTHPPRNPANITYDDDDDGEDDIDDEEDDIDDGVDEHDDLHDDRHFYSHGAQRAAGAPVPRSGSSRRIRVFKSSRRDASGGASAGNSDLLHQQQQSSHNQSQDQQLTVRSVFSSLWSFVWGGLSEPFIRGVVIGAGVCVVHYLLVIKRRR
jgi:hypothetical protein